MKRGHQHAGPVRVGLAAQPRDPFLRSDEGLRREVAEGQDHVGRDRVDLGHQERAARRDLVGLRIAIALGPALHHVGDVAVALALEAHRGQHPGEELAGAPDEGQALAVFFFPRSLADHHEPGPRVAGAERDVGPAPTELAELAALAGALLIAQGVGRIGEGDGGQGQLAQTQIAVMA